MTSSELAAYADRDFVGASAYSFELFAARIRRLFHTSAYADLERLCGIVSVPGYVALIRNGVPEPQAIVGAAFLAVTIAIGVYSLALVLLPKRRRRGIFGLVAGLGVIVFWVWFFFDL